MSTDSYLVERGETFVWFECGLVDVHLVLVTRPMRRTEPDPESYATGCGVEVTHEVFITDDVRWDSIALITCEVCRERTLLAVLRDEEA